MVVDQNSFIPERPFFANKNFTFAKLSRTPCLSSAEPMLANNTSYEDSFTTCQITPENHGSLLGSLLNMQLASQNPFSGLICFCKVYWPTPFSMHFDFRPLFRITFAELSRKHPYSQTPAISRGCTEGKAKTRSLGVIWLLQSLTFGNLATTTRILWCPSPAGPRAAVGGSPLHIMINNMSQNTWRHDRRLLPTQETTKNQPGRDPTPFTRTRASCMAHCLRQTSIIFRQRDIRWIY